MSAQHAHHAEVRERFAHFKPQDHSASTLELRRPNAHWDDFELAQAHAWAGVLLIAQQRPAGVTVKAAASQSWRGGSVVHLPGAADTARAARELGFTPDTFWELVTALRALSPQKHRNHPLRARGGAGSEWAAVIPFDPDLWASWPRIYALSGDALEATRMCLDGVAV